MQSTLFVLGMFPPPAAIAFVFALAAGTGAAFASDRQIALVVEAVVWNVVFFGIEPEVAGVPVNERVDFNQPGTPRILFDLLEFLAGSALIHTPSGNPCIVAFERAVERLDFADAAAFLAVFQALFE